MPTGGLFLSVYSPALPIAIQGSGAERSVTFESFERIRSGKLFQIMAAAPTHGMSLKPILRPTRANAGRQLPSPITAALQSLDSWIEDQGFRGWDPHDALNSPLLRRLTLQNRYAAIFWLQLLRRSPVNFRPLLAIPKDYNAKGMGLFLASYAHKYAVTHEPRYRDYVNFLAQWLLKNAAPDYRGMGWGYNFDWPNRAFFAPAGTPTVVNTAFIGLAFLDMHLLLGNEVEWSSIMDGAEVPGGERHSSSSALDVARSSCDFVLRDLNVLAPTADERCFSYTPLDRRFVHNASMMGAWLLASVFKQTGEPHLGEAALAAARFTARRQLPDGAWSYGIVANERWVDNFHTGFVLVALKRVGDYLQTDEFDKSVLRGYRFWKERMFLPDGTPKYYPDRTHPVDVHSVAQAILTFLEFRQEDEEGVEHAVRVAQWGIENLQDPTGYFYYQSWRSYTVRIPYMRWAQAWMQRALTELVYG